MLVNVGFNNMVNKDRIIAVVSPETSPIKRLVQDSKDNGRAIDVTCGRRTRSVIITDSDHVILSAIQCETLANRIADGVNSQNNNELAEEDKNDE